MRSEQIFRTFDLLTFNYFNETGITRFQAHTAQRNPPAKTNK